MIVNLRADPYEKAPNESGLYLRWYADNIWLFVPVQQKLKAFLADAAGVPVPAGQQPERRRHQLRLAEGDAGHEAPAGAAESAPAEQLSASRNRTFVLVHVPFSMNVLMFEYEYVYE